MAGGRARRCAAWTASLSLVVACGGGEPAPQGGAAPEARETTRWVSVFDPERSWDGVNLDLFDRAVPALFDTSGRVLHVWPLARVQERVRLLADGHLLAIGRERNLLELDWDGKTVWEARLAGRIPHHDVIRLRNGHRMALTRPIGSGWDAVVELDDRGEIVWEWRAEEHLAAPPGSRLRDVTHLNSVEELAENPWFDAGDARFRPGNLLLSARNLDRILVVDRESGDVVWSFGDGLDRQHEARMIPRGLRGAGEILVFSNGSQGRHGYRRSRLVQLDPVRGEAVWSYSADGFYARIGGVAQVLPRDTVLVTSSRGQRVFELTRDGEIVWQWMPPFPPVRAQRYAWDHCPQLASLHRPPAGAVEAPPGARWVDAPAYRFDPNPRARRPVKVPGETLSALRDNQLCSRLLLPARPQVALRFGLDAEGLQAAGRPTYAARFSLTARLDDEPVASERFAATLELGRRLSGEKVILLDPYAFHWTEVCVATEEVGAPGQATEPFAYWLEPRVSDLGVADEDDEENPPGDLTPEELGTRREHLKALGYVQ